MTRSRPAARGTRRTALLLLSSLLALAPTVGQGLAAPAAASPGGFTSLTPARILDTRIGLGAPKARLGAGATLTLPVTGRGGVPAGAAAVVLSLTAVHPTVSGYVSAYPAGAARPVASSLNFAPQQTVANLVTATVGAGGAITLYNNAGTVDLVADVSGWYASTSSYHPITPTRLLDTRSGNDATIGPLLPSTNLGQQVSGLAGVPATGAVAVALNVTAVTPSGSGYLTEYPNGESRPTTSVLNYASGRTVANGVLAKLSPTGGISVQNEGGTIQLVIDVTGWYGPGGDVVPLSPSRLADTRRAGGPIGPNGHLDLVVTGRGGVPATGVGAVAINLTAVAPTAAGNLTAGPWAPTITPPTMSNVNFARGQTVAVLAIVKVGPGGRIRISNAAGSTHVVVDVMGWFAG